MPRRKKNGGSLDDQSPYWFDASEAQRAVDFFAQCLVHIEGEWADAPLALEDWQVERILRPTFGWKVCCPALPRTAWPRRYRIVYIEIPRKNGKSTLAAGVALYLTFCDREPGAQVVSAAADREQAGIVFESAKKMVEKSRLLRAHADVWKRSIVVPKTNSAYKVLSADAYTKHGLNLHGVVFDELHTQPSRDLWDVLRTGTSARRQPLIVAMTTAGYDRQSICWEIHDYAAKVSAGLITDDTFLSVLYGIDPARLQRAPECWQDPAVWREVNPNLGVSKKLDYMISECKRAIETPANENTFKRLELNIWTEQSVRWLPMDAWDACSHGPLDPATLAGRACYAGLDLAATIDVAALVLVFPPPAGAEVYQVLSYFWVPRDTLALRERQQKTTYRAWVDARAMIATEGNVIDYDVIRACIAGPAVLAKTNPEIVTSLPAKLAAWGLPAAGLGATYQIKEIAIDRWNSTQLQTQLQGDGFTVVQFGQGFGSMSAPTKELEKLVLGRRLQHGGHSVLRWMASNVSVKQDPAGNLKPDKATSSEKIDGIVALIMALGRAIVQPATKKSVYEERGLTTV